ncbi:MAG: hypothetical protein ACRCRZ_03035 [Metamycoplasmataceae bacterium]
MFLEENIEGLVIDHIDSNIINGLIIKVLSKKEIYYIKAKGVKKINSKNRLNIQIGMKSEFSVLKSGNTYLLKKAVLIKDYFVNHRDDFLFIKNFLEVFSFIKENNSTFLITFYELEDYIISHDRNYWVRTYLLKTILFAKGLNIVFDHCIVCGSNQNLYSFNFHEGGMICKIHSKNKTNLSELKSFYFLSKNFMDYFSNTSAKDNLIIYEKMKIFLIEN